MGLPESMQTIQPLNYRNKITGAKVLTNFLQLAIVGIGSLGVGHNQMPDM